MCKLLLRDYFPATISRRCRRRCAVLPLRSTSCLLALVGKGSLCGAVSCCAPKCRVRCGWMHVGLVTVQAPPAACGGSCTGERSRCMHCTTTWRASAAPRARPHSVPGAASPTCSPAAPPTRHARALSATTCPSAARVSIDARRAVFHMGVFQSLTRSLHCNDVDSGRLRSL